jgi:3-hydroxyacyl-[acyl-carrier-protein] dehydratase
MKQGRAALAIGADHPAFAGHFPGQPIVPGVVLLDLALHAVGSALATDLSACRIGAVKFLSPLGPGEPAAVDFELSDSGALRFDIVSGERRIATASLRT